jgi:Protein of unknown function (DUF3732)
MQIKAIVLYGHSGEKRTLSFQVGKVNIVTGKSKTGKSALINIIDYCLGRSSFLIPEGIIRETVAWYAVIFQLHDSQIFIAKPRPTGYATSQNQVYLEINRAIAIPELSQLIPNSNDDALVSQLSGLLGISANQNTPDQDESREPLRATLKHGKFYLFQDQNTISNKHCLFYRQQETFVSQAIKDTLPYFLGVTQENQLILQEELRRVRRELKMAKRQLREVEYVVSDRSDRGLSLLAEAQQVGLLNLESFPDSTQEILELLRRSLEWEPNETPSVADDQFPHLHREIEVLSQDLRNQQDKIVAAETFVRQAEGYSSEAQQQVMRLESIHLFKATEIDTAHCPFCGSEVEALIPNISAIQNSLDNLQQNVHIVEGKQPKIREYIESLKAERADIKNLIIEKQGVINAILDEQEVARRLRDFNARIYRVLGRISLFLETVEFTDETSALRQRVEQYQNAVNRLESQLDPIDAEEILRSILNRLGLKMTEWANFLELEHQESPYRLDVKKLTVVADRPERPIPMDRMGSGENWLGCHLIAHLALHKHFIEKQRPVPNFLVLDQPSQVYFPSKEAYLAMEGKTAQEIQGANADIQAVNRMFKLLFDICEELSPHLQIIVLEHANLEDERFQQALVEDPWTNGQALIPANFRAS